MNAVSNKLTLVSISISLFATLISCGRGKSTEQLDSPLSGQYAYARYVDNSRYSFYMGGIVEFTSDGKFVDKRLYRFYENYNTGLEVYEYNVVYKGEYGIDGDTLRRNVSEKPKIEYLGNGDGYLHAETVIADDYVPSDCKYLSLGENVTLKIDGCIVELFTITSPVGVTTNSNMAEKGLLITKNGFGSYDLSQYANEQCEKMGKLLIDVFSMTEEVGMDGSIYSFSFKDTDEDAFYVEDGVVHYTSPKFYTTSGLHVGSSIVDFLSINGFSKKCYTSKYEPTWVSDGTFTYYLSDNESVSSHYVQEEYWESGDITNLNAVITDIVRNIDNTASTTVNETVSVEYFENGKIKKETFYRNGEKQRTVEYFENGSVFEEMTFDEEGNYFGNWRRYGPDENGNGHYLIFESKIDANGNGYEWYRYNEDRRRATNISVKTTYLNHKPVSEVYSKLINGEWRQFEY